MADQKKRAHTLRTKQNVLETLKDLGSSATSQAGDLVRETSQDFFRELVGIKKSQEKRSGEIQAGESVQISEVISGQEEENKKLRAQILLERNLASDEKRISQEKTDNLRVQLQALMTEVAKVAAST